MKKTDLLVIGGSAGGILTATAARKIYPDIKVTLVRKNNSVVVPCGIPYIFGTLKDPAKNRVPDAMLTDAGISLLIDSASKIDPASKTVLLEQAGEISYDKLVIATGSLPVVPKTMPGRDLSMVFPITKSEEYLKDMLDRLTSAQKVIVIGGGFIGVEFAEQLQKDGKQVTIIELAERCLWQSFDDEVCDLAENEMRENGIDLRTGIGVNKILGDSTVTGVELSNGEVIPADAIILGMGVTPNSHLAREAGIKINNNGAVMVDEYMRTSLPDIFAVGDCAEKRCAFTSNDIPILLASTAAMEAKVAAINLYGINYIRENTGTISAFSTKLYNKAFASAGITERRAQEEGFAITIGRFTTMDRHPGSLPGSSKLEMKLIFAKHSGIIIGAQVYGSDSAGEIINILGLAILKAMTASELNTFQVATHPLLTSSPITYPINAAALDALSKEMHRK